MSEVRKLKYIWSKTGCELACTNGCRYIWWSYGC